MPIFKGAGVAIVTPMKENLEVDYDALETNINYQIDNGTDAIVIAGTTGESATLSEEEHKKVVKAAVEFTKHRVPVIAGTGSNSTQTAIELSQEADADGVDAHDLGQGQGHAVVGNGELHAGQLAVGTGEIHPRSAGGDLTSQQPGAGRDGTFQTAVGAVLQQKGYHPAHLLLGGESAVGGPIDTVADDGIAAGGAAGGGGIIQQ